MMPRRLPRLAGLLSTLALLLWTLDGHGYTYVDDCAPTWPDLPVTYYIADDGSEQFEDLAPIEVAVADSFSAWQSPCCSSFEAEYGGPVSRQEDLDDQSYDTTIAFEDRDWPAAYGGPDAIAVTLLSIDIDCQIREAPLRFNSEDHDFVVGGEATEGEVDLQSIATHELGHLLGLGHSQLIEATMFGLYVGGTAPRTLHDDDIDGVCSLYAGECRCTDDNDCRSAHFCDDGVCAREICAGDGDCPDNSICEGGDCVFPPCTDGEDCDDDSICQNERCVDPCPACRRCNEHADCGHQGFCRPFDHGGRCMIACGQDGQCPGDSVCTEVAQGLETFALCAAPGAGDSDDLCPADYICRDFDENFEPCPALGNNCATDDYQCSPANDVCVEGSDDALICSCTCAADADCGADSECIAVGGGQSACIPGESDGVAVESKDESKPTGCGCSSALAPRANWWWLVVVVVAVGRRAYFVSPQSRLRRS